MANGIIKPNSGSSSGPDRESGRGPDHRRNGKPGRKRSSLPDAITLFVLVMVLAVFGIISLVAPKPEVSQIENRPLEKAPHFSLKTLASGEFTDSLSRYYSDTFPWREKMIETSSDFKSRFGLKGNESGGDVSIHYGVDTAGGKDDAPKDGSGDSATTENAVAVSDGAVSPSGSAVTTPPPASEPEEDLGNELTGEGTREGGVIVIGDTALEFYGFAKKTNERYADVINAFDDRYSGQITTTALVAPTNIEFRLPKKYADLSDSQRDAIDFIYKRLNPSVVKVDAYDSLKKHAKEYEYFRTDHHWTPLGAFYAYRDYCAALGLSHAGLLSYSQMRLDGFLGSFYNSIGGNNDMKNNPDYLLAYIPYVPYEATGYENSAMQDGYKLNLVRGPDEIQIANKYVALSGSDLSVLDIKTQNQTGRNLIIFKESFANAFIPFLTENYDEILVIDFRYFEGNVNDLIQQYNINEALFLNYVSAAGSEKQVDRLAEMFRQ